MKTIAELDRHRYMSLATFRRSGAELATPVWFAAADGRPYVFPAKLGYRNELAAIAGPSALNRKYGEMVAGMYERGRGLNTASLFEIDAW